LRILNHMLFILAACLALVLLPRPSPAATWDYTISPTDTPGAIDTSATTAIVDTANREIRLPPIPAPDIVSFWPSGEMDYIVLTTTGVKHFSYDGITMVENTLLNVNISNPLALAAPDLYPDVVVADASGIKHYSFSGSAMVNNPALSVAGLTGVAAMGAAGQNDLTALVGSQVQHYTFDGASMVRNTVLEPSVSFTNPIDVALGSGGCDTAVLEPNRVRWFNSAGSGMVENPALAVTGLTNPVAMAVADPNNGYDVAVIDGSQVKHYSFNGSNMVYNSTLSVTSGLTAPRAVAIRPGNVYGRIIADGNHVKFYGWNGSSLVYDPNRSVTVANIVQGAGYRSSAVVVSQAMDPGANVIAARVRAAHELPNGTSITWSVTADGNEYTNDDPTSDMLSQHGLSNYFPGSCVDNNVNSHGWHTDSSKAGAWLQVDLGAGNAKAYTKARIYAVSGGYKGNYSVQYSEDGTNWYSAATDFNPSAAGWNEKTWSSVGTHRYWRFYLTNTPVHGPWLNEMEWYTSPNWVKKWRVRGTASGTVLEISPDNGVTWNHIGTANDALPSVNNKQLWATVTPGRAVKWKAELATSDPSATPKIATSPRGGVAVRLDTNSAPNPPTLPSYGTCFTTTTPTLSWTFSDPDAGDSQSAYQVQAARASDLALAIDSGKVISEQTQYVVPTSAAPDTPGPLWSAGAYQFKYRVRVWDQAGAASPWSSWADFCVVAFERPRAAQIVSPPAGQVAPDPVNPATHIVITPGMTVGQLSKVKAGAKVVLLVDSVGPLDSFTAAFPYLSNTATTNTPTKMPDGVTTNPMYPAGNPVNRWAIEFWTNPSLAVCPSGTVVQMRLTGSGGAGAAGLNAPPYADGAIVTDGSIYGDWFVVLQGRD